MELVGREVERRTVLYALAYPVSRAAYLVGRFAGVVSLLGVASLMLGSLLWVSARYSGGQYVQAFVVQLGWPYWIAIGGLWADAIVVAAFALLIATLSTVPMLPVALGAAFAVAGKTLGAALDYMARGADGDQDLLNRYGPLVETIQWVLPDLSRLDWRIWPMYGVPLGADVIAYALLLACGYVVILMSLAVFAFARREFF